MRLLDAVRHFLWEKVIKKKKKQFVSNQSRCLESEITRVRTLNDK